jgi:hypothetical protein
MSEAASETDLDQELAAEDVACGDEALASAGDVLEFIGRYPIVGQHAAA